MSTLASLDSIRVAIRIRPLIKRESDCHEYWCADGDTIYQINDNAKKVPNTTFTFDRIFGRDQSTVDIYMDFAKPVVHSVMEGYNGTLFAYGQTSSGKTYTMSGTEDSPGIIPYALDEVFNFISKSQNREFLLRVSYMEIYNETITDLLNPKSTNLKIRENVKGEISVEKLTEEVVTSVDDIIFLMKIGEKNRHVGSTNMNQKSSRSHTIFRMVAESRETTSRNSINENGDFDGAVMVSHLNLVDLAGSERASTAGTGGIRLKEGSFINKSLMTLGLVINKLSEESPFVPFRESKLTRILQNSLGGNAKTSIICAVTPASIDETLSTLQFANRAKTIKNRPEVNEVLDDGTMLKRCRKEISELKRALEKSHSREEVLKREMELKKEKDMIENELEQQRKIADETKAKLRQLANFFCTPKEVEAKQLRKQRRWTMCPMGAHNKPVLQQLDLTFDRGFSKPCRRLEQTFAGSPSRCDSVSSEEFNEERHQLFLHDLRERENDVIAEESSTSSKNSIQHFPTIHEEKSKEDLIADYEKTIAQMKQDFDDRIEYLREAVEQKEQELLASLRSELDCERNTTTKLTEERNSLQNDLNWAVEDVKKLKEEVQIKSDEVLTLESRVNETNQAMRNLKRENEIQVEDLQQRMNALKTDFEKLLKENDSLKTISATYQIQLEERNLDAEVHTGIEMSSDVQSSEASCKSCRRQSVIRSERENEVFKLLLEDIKEQVGCERDKLVDELNHALVAAQEKIEQKDFVLDEKEFEFLEQTQLVEQLQEDCQKGKTERNTLQDEVEHLSNAMAEKSQTIADLEKKLIEMYEKDATISQLEMDIEVLQGEITSLNGRSDADQQSISELKQVIYERENIIVQLEACKAGLELEREETMGDDVRDLRSSLVALEEEKSRQIQEIQDMQEKSKLSNVNLELLEEEIKHRDKELENYQAELNEMKTSFKTVSDELKSVKAELYENQTEHKEEMKKVEDALQVAEGAFKTAMDDRTEMEEILKAKQAECEQHEEKNVELEMNIDLLRNEILQLNAYKAGLELQRDEAMAGEICDLRSSLVALEEQKSRQIQEIKAMQEKSKLSNVNIELLEEGINQKNITRKKELENYQMELKGMKTSFETVSDELKSVKVELYQKQTEHKEEMKKAEDALQVAEGAFKTAMDDRTEMEEILKAKQAECEQHKEKNVELEMNIDLLKDEILQLNVYKAGLKLVGDENMAREMRDLRSSLVALEEEKSRQIQEIQDMQEKSKLSSVNIELLEEGINQKNKELENYQTELKGMKTSFETVSDELKSVKVELNQKQTEHKEEMKKAEDALQVAEGAFKTAMDDRTEMEEILKSKQVECEQHKEKNVELEMNIDLLKDEIIQLNAYKAGLKLERDETMAGEMRDLRSSLVALEEEKSRQIQEIQDMQEKSKLSNVNIELLEEGINQKNKELENYQAELNEMKTSFKTVSDELKSVKVELYGKQTEHKEEMKKAEDALQVAEGAFKTAMDDRTEMEEVLKAKQAECEQHKEKNVELEMNIDLLENEILQLNAYKAGLKLERDEAMAGEMRDLRSSLAALEEEKSRQIQEIQDMQEKSKLSSVNIELLEEGINQKNKELENYQTELNEMKTSFKIVSDELKSVKVELYQKQTEHKEEMKKAEDALQVAEGAFKTAMDDRTEMEEILKAKQAECDQDKEKNVELEMNIDLLKDEILQLNAYKAGLKLERDEAMAGEMRDLRSSLVALEEQKSRQIQEIQDMQEKSKLSNVNIELLEEKINQKNKELKNYQTELNEMKTSFKTVSDELKSVKVELYEKQTERKEEMKKAEDALQVAEGAFKTAMDDRTEMEEILKAKQVEYNSYIRLQTQKNGKLGELQRRIAQLSSQNAAKKIDCEGDDEQPANELEIKDLEIAHLHGRLNELKERFHIVSREAGKSGHALQKYEDEVTSCKSEIESLQGGNEELKRKLENSDSNKQQRQSSHEEAMLKFNNELKVVLERMKVECWKHVERIVDLEIQQNELMEEFKEANLRHDLVIGELKRRIAELSSENAETSTSANYKENDKRLAEDLKIRNQEKAHLHGLLNELKERFHRVSREAGKNSHALQECADEITLYKLEIETLQEGNEELERILENSDKTEQQRYSSQELCNLDLAKELKKVKNELKTKGQDLDQVNFEKNQQIERAKDKIYQLEKDLANYAKRNNDLKAELRGLRNREEEPTVDMIRGKAPSSSSGENVGVVGSVALLTLNARVDKLTRENKVLQAKCESLEKENSRQKLDYLETKQNLENMSPPRPSEPAGSSAEFRALIEGFESLKDENSKPAVGHRHFKPSIESAFRKPLKFPNEKPLSTGIKAAEPSRSSKAASDSVGFARRMEQKQECSENPVPRQTARQPLCSNKRPSTEQLVPFLLEKKINLNPFKENKKNKLSNKQEDDDTPDECKTS